MDQAMRLDRSISAGPRRGVEQTCTSIADFVTEIVDERGYPDVAGVRKGFDAIFPILRYLLTTRKFAEPAIAVRMPELIIRISVRYDVDADENMEVPNLALLEKLPESALIEISLDSADEVPASLRSALGKASSKGIRFTVASDVTAELDAILDDADSVPGPPASDVSDADDADIVEAKIVPPEEEAESGAPIIGDR
jgi:hypothetical protein